MVDCSEVMMELAIQAMIEAVAEAESRGATGKRRIHHVIPAVAKNNQI